MSLNEMVRVPLVICFACIGIIHGEEAAIDTAPTIGPVRFATARYGLPVFVRVQLVGRDTLFFVDTGSFQTVLDESLAELVGPAVRSGRINTLSGPVAVDYRKAPNMEMQGLKLASGGTVILQDLSPLRQATGLDVRGVLGCDKLDGMSLTVNSREGFVIIAGGGQEPDPRTEWVSPLVFVRGVPVVELQLHPEGKRSGFVVDTGFTGFLGAPESIWTSMLPHYEENSRDTDIELETAAGQSTVLQRLGGRIEFGPFSFERSSIMNTPKPVLGLALLEYFEYRIDFFTKQLALRGRIGTRLNNAWGISGLGLRFEDDKTVITRVNADGPLGSSAFRPGDILVEFGSRKLDTWDVEQFTHACHQSAGEEIQITVVRAGRRLTTTCRLKTLQ